MEARASLCWLITENEYFGEIKWANTRLIKDAKQIWEGVVDRRRAASSFALINGINCSANLSLKTRLVITYLVGQEY